MVMLMVMVRVMVVVLVSRDVLQTAVLTALRGEYIVVAAWPCTTVTTAYSQFIDPPRLSGPGRSVLAVSQYSVLAQPAL